MSEQFEKVAHRLFEGGGEQEEIGHFLDLAIAENRLEEGEAALGRLAKAIPGDDRILGARVALLLKAGKTGKALELIQDRLAEAPADSDFLQAALAIRHSLGPRPPLDEIRPDCRISLCMIVKNEVNNIGRCLNSVRHLADEIVVVDTGSEDETPVMAAIYGARVVSFKWVDDFSAARNYGIGQAKYPWILVLDADECLADGDCKKIRALVADSPRQNMGFSIMTRNYTRLANIVGWQPNDGRYPELEAGCGWFPSWKVRLFRNSPEVQFRYPVHERVDPALKEAGAEIRKADVVVQHYGSLDQVKAIAKAEKYYHLAMAKLEKMRRDPAALRELAVQAAELEKWEQAVELWSALLALRPDWTEACVNLAGAYWNMQRYDKTVEFATRAIDLDKDCKEAHFNLAIGLLMQAKAGEALEILEVLTRKYPDYLAAEFQLIVCMAAAGKSEAAFQRAARLAERITRPVWQEAVIDFTKRMEKAGLAKMAQHVRLLESCN